MKTNIGIYPRILWMLIGTAVVLLAILTALFVIKNKQERIMFEESQLQFQKEVNSIIALKTATLRQVAYDYTYWDEFIDKLETKDTAWFNNNITTILKSFRVDYVCVYDTLFNIVHEASIQDSLSPGFIETGSLVRLKESRFLNFFQLTAQGVMEVSSASIHPETDPTHTLTKPRGYLYLARKWDNRIIEELSGLCAAKVSIQWPDDTRTNLDKYSYFAIHELNGWDGENAGQLFFSRISNSYLLYHNMSLYIMIIIVFSFLTIFLLFHFTTRLWINNPLKLVMSILKSGDPVLIKELQQSYGEFKNIGFLFGEFISQKKELKIAKEKAEESDRLKTAFLANMSHEIRTPMNGILGFAGLLKESNLTGEEQKKYIAIIEKSGERMLNIINDIVEISKIQSGPVKLELSDIDLNEQTRFLHNIFMPEATNKNLSLILKIPEEIGEMVIKTDREKLNTILTNLLKNAIKYTPQGSIEFGYNVVGTTGRLPQQTGLATIQFYVKDTGIGIPKARQQAIFERFVQADIEDKNAFEGAGLGLAISNAYAKMLGGSIVVESETGKGSTFWLNLPLLPVTENISAERSKHRVEKESSSIKKDFTILIAEDEATSDFYLTEILKAECRQIMHASTGAEAVEACRKNPGIDLILMDLKMPVMNGYDATRMIRSFNTDIIIIAQTAYALSGDREKALEAGCNEYISKPVGKDLLFSILRPYLTKKTNE